MKNFSNDGGSQNNKRNYIQLQNPSNCAILRKGIAPLSSKRVGCIYEKGRVNMKNTMSYRGYIGSVEFSEEDGIFFGTVQEIRSLISYEGTNAKELVEEFHGAVDEYMEACAKDGREPEAAYKGSLNIRIGSDLHRRAAVFALEHAQTLNRFIADAVRDKLERAE